MPDKPLSFSATCALLILMAEDREMSNPELKEKYGVTITGKERTTLNEGKLVDSSKKGRSYSHVLTDKGWHYASELFREGVAAPAGGFAAAAVRALVGGLQRHIARGETSLAEIFGRQGDLGPADNKEPVSEAASDARAPETPDAPARSPEEVETLIRKAYAQLAERPNAWVSLTRLRPLLGDVPRDEVDATLRRMIARPDVRLVPWESQKTLTQEDRDAAVVIGDQPKHRIWIGA
ncbi:MAG: hypothetical protein IRZ07_18935 [Microbispora sp.]|nr:hypothetical protein [Microbispora sp.]